ncbi:MAG: hypothetical protein U0R71_16705 [Solirubrobacterales bacterium]
MSGLAGGSRSGSIAQRRKSSTGRASWSTVRTRNTASPVAARPAARF